MKVIHIVRQSKFMGAAQYLYDHYFNNGEHEICYINKGTEMSLIREDLSIRQTQFNIRKGKFIQHFPKLIKELMRADYIVLHSLLFPDPVLLLLSVPVFRNKIVWIEWGADLYSFLNERKNIIVKRACNLIMEKCFAFIGIFPPDIDTYKRLFPASKAMTYYAPYISGLPVYPTALDIYMSSEKQLLNRNKEIIIQIGHNAIPTLNHKEVLYSLKKYSNENIKIVLPLSYGGSPEYVAEVSGIARELFGDKAVVIDKYLDKKDYFHIIDSVDIAIFNTHRQAGLANIHRLLSKKAKLFIPKGSVMYDYFRSVGFPVCAYEQIDTQSFDEFIALCEPLDEVKVIKYLEERSDNDKKVQYWRNIYDSLRNIRMNME